MASFLRQTFDNVVNNINHTLNQHTNLSPRSPRAQQQQQQQRQQPTPPAQSQARASGDRPPIETPNSRIPGVGCGNCLRGRAQSRNSPSTRQSTTSQQRSQARPSPNQYNRPNPHTARHTSSNVINTNVPGSNMSANAESQQPQQSAAEKQFDISDVQDPQDINQLSAKQLKTILTKNCIDFRGVFEKEVLREKVLQLWIDCNQRGNSNRTGSGECPDDIDDSQACKICMEHEINCVFLECGHMLTCVPCGRKLAECPICRQNIIRCVRTFKG